MHPASILSYYPTYAILDEIRTEHNYYEMNLFIDLKNVLQATYMEHTVVNLVESTKLSRFIDTSVFSSLISFLVFHKMWAIQRGVKLNFYVFYEIGTSFYHTTIDRRYKISRSMDDLHGLDRENRELFTEIMQTNFKLINKACSRIPRLWVFQLKHLEADFLPYYLLTRGHVSKNGEAANIIYSNDHDMWQCLDDHVYVFSKIKKQKRIIRKGEALTKFLKRDAHIPDVYLPLAMSIIGDTSDDVVGIRGIGPATFLKIYSELVDLTGNMTTIYAKINKNEKLFSTSTETGNKYLKQIVDAELENYTISKNLKLVSFELLSRAIDEPNKTEMLERQRFILETLNHKPETVDAKTLKNALVQNGVELDEMQPLDYLYL
jgi:hypothetical protein